jgi:salicylate hydroxylase
VTTNKEVVLLSLSYYYVCHPIQVSSISMGSTEPDHKPFSIAIVGGGLGGLALAIGLLRHNVPIQIYEAARAFSEIGAGVSFGPNTLRAVALIDPTLEAGFERCVTRNGWEEKKRTWMIFRLGCDVPDSTGDGRLQGQFGDLVLEMEARETGQSSVHRARFLDELVKLIPDGISHFGKAVEDVRKTSSGVQLVFGDGTTAEASAAIGCDGIKSRVRAILLEGTNVSPRPQFAGEYAFRGVISMAKAIEVLGEYAARNGHIYIGNGG